MTEPTVVRSGLTLDHIVHVVQDPETTRHVFEQELGFHTVPGGVHSAWGTWNTLAYFGLSYIEWLGVRDAHTAKTTEFGRMALSRLSVGEGVGQFALRTNAIDQLADSWRHDGLGFTGPIEASRTRPDGTTLSWRMLFPAQQTEADGSEAEPLLPFVIEWDQDDASRLETLSRLGAVPRIQTWAINGLHLASRHPEKWLTQFLNYFGTRRNVVHNDFFRGRDIPFTVDLNGTSLQVWPAPLAWKPSQQDEAVVPGIFRLDLSKMEPSEPPLTPPAKYVLAGLQLHLDA